MWRPCSDGDCICKSIVFCCISHHVSQVEDHYPEGGIGDAVLDAVADIRNVVVKKLAVNAVPRSGDYQRPCNGIVNFFKSKMIIFFRSSDGTVGDVRHLCQLHLQGGDRIDFPLGNQSTQPTNQDRYRPNHGNDS